MIVTGTKVKAEMSSGLRFHLRTKSNNRRTYVA
jgi:hypothetical protein